jgi:phosphotransferase system enzyme I (PtsI)
MTSSPHRLSGIPASPGIAVGRAYLVDRRRVKTPKRHIPIEELDDEVARFRHALQLSHEQLERIKRRLEEREGEEHFQILEAHQLMIADERLVVDTIGRIRQEHINAEWALRKTVEEIKDLFEEIEDDYFRERRSDIDFVGDRVLRNLLGAEDKPVAPPPDSVIIAHDLSPADTAQLRRYAVAAIVTDAGARTSHTAIMARAFQIPAVVGTEAATQRIGAGDLVIVDAIEGEVLIAPAAETVADYRDRLRRYTAFELALLKDRDTPATTLDGVRLRLQANIELLDEVPLALEHGAEGLGLFRTEFVFMNRATVPSEAEHYQLARSVVDRLRGRVATFRTFDLGGDKLAPLQSSGAEANPALGLRSIRLALRERDLFKAQLRGLLRATVHTPDAALDRGEAEGGAPPVVGQRHGLMRLMFPMISGVGELREAKAVLEEAKDELRRQGLPFDERLPVGIMIEMPSAAIIADMLAPEVDFFSIGTNDLIQYSLAIDRVNEHVSYLYHPLHPAILRLVRTVVAAGHAAGIEVGMCGEMAGEPIFSMVLAGLGLDSLSMNPVAIPIVKSVLRSINAADARSLADQALLLPTSDEIEELVWTTMAGRFPEHVLRGITSVRSAPRGGPLRS